jgi:hypothetical protein
MRPHDATWLAEQDADYSTLICPRGVVTCVPNYGCQELVVAFARAICEALGFKLNEELQWTS